MSTTRATYAARILRVQRFIQEHLHEELTLDRLAEVAGYSPYHFHRIFRGQVGESTDDYVRRLRMEQAAHSLRYRQKSILDIALDAGYGSHEAFTRAFVRNFGVTPTEYQSTNHPPPSIKEQLMNTAMYSPEDVRIERLPARRLACFRVVGPYSAEFLGPAFGRICHWAGEHGMWTPDARCVGVYYDDPDVTPHDKLRADVGITISENAQPPGDVQVQTIAAGTYAVLRHKGPYDQLGEAYRWFYSVWLPDSGHEPADAPPYEYYVNDASDLPPEELLTDICIPLASQS